jgi:hypothetical protein
MGFRAKAGANVDFRRRPRMQQKRLTVRVFSIPFPASFLRLVR